MDSVLDKITCLVCKQPFSDTPKVLPTCLHVFCLACLNKLPIALNPAERSMLDCSDGNTLTVRNSSPSPLELCSSVSSEIQTSESRTSSPSSDFILSVSCPKCKRSSCIPASGFNGMKTSYVRSNLADAYNIVQELRSKLPCAACDKCVEISPAVSYCCTCRQLICEDHAKCHKVWKELLEHKLIELNTLSHGEKKNSDIKHLVQQIMPSLKLGDMDCPIHSSGNIFKFFCSPCEDLACVRCTHSTHREGPRHSCVSLTPAVVSERREIVVQALEMLNNLLKDLDVFATTVQTQGEAISNKGAIIKDRVDAVFTEIIDSLESRKLALFNEVDDITSKPLKKLKECDKKIVDLRAHIVESCDFVDENLNCGGDLGLMTVAGVISNYSKGIIEEYKSLLPEGRVDSPTMEFIADGEKLCDNIATFGRVNSNEDWNEFSRSDWPGYLPPGLKFRASMYSKTLSSFNSVTGVFDSELQNSLTSEYSYSHSSLSTVESPSSQVTISVPKFAGIYLRTISGTAKPCGITVNEDMSLLVCELESHQVVIFAQDGKKISTIGKKGDSNGQFLFPQKAVSDSRGKILVVDSMHRLQMFNENKKFMAAFGKKGKGPVEFNYPVSILISPDNHLFVCERDNQRIQVLNKSFKFQTFIGQAGADKCEFDFPSDIAISESGFIYVADSGNHRIQVLTLQGFIFSFGKKGSLPGELCQPSHLCVDSEGVYVSEEGNHRVSVFTLNGLFVRCIGKNGKNPGEFQRPMGVAIDKNRTLYVCDCYNDRIQIFK